MKKLSLTLLAVAATTLAYGEKYYTIPAAGTLFGGDTSPLISDTITQDNDGFTGGVVTVKASKQMTVGNFNRDFTFNGIVLNNTADKTVNFDFKITNGAKLTFNNQMGYDTVKSARYAFIGNATDRGNVEINTNFFNKNTTPGIGVQEFWMDRVDVVYNGADAKGKMGYTHFFKGATLKVTKNLEISTLALRSFANIEGKDTYGSLIIDNSTVTIGSFVVNNKVKVDGVDTPVKGGSYQIKFANAGKAEALVIESTSATSFNDDYEIALEFVDFGKDDKIYSAVDLTTFDKITVNGTALSTLIDTDVIVRGSNDDYSYIYSLAAVPEPATYATIFGALALGFAMYRRRK